jgi:hypothetical protein
MRIIKYILIILILSSCSTKNEDKQQKLPNIDIHFQTGCEVREDFSISILTENGNLIARKIKPNYYYGVKTDSIWTVHLDSNGIAVIDMFIHKAEELNGECPIKNTSVDDYKIKIHNDTTFKIYGHCDWDSLDYFSIEKELFKSHFDDLEQKRETLKDSISSALNGKWIVTGLDNLKQNDTVTFWRTNELDDIEEGTVIWMFSDSLKFTSFDNKLFDLTYSKDYELILKNGYNHLRIGSGAVIDNKGNMTIENYGANFEIINIDNEIIKLKYWWR